MRHTSQSLDALRHEGDPPADAVIADLVGSGKVGEVNRILREFHGNDQPIPAGLPPAVHAFLKATDAPPEWADASRIANAHDFFVDDGMHVATVLCYGAMASCYAARVPSRVLDITHRLDQPHRRLAETCQFVVNMMAPDPFGSGGSFVPTIQKTRLIHAAVRHLVRSSPQWDEARDGVPICQEDLLGAMMIFSVHVIDGMRRLGITVTDQEAEDYYYVWRVAGAMLGIRPEIAPETLAEAREVNALLVERHLGSSPEGIELTRDLLAFYEEMIPGKAFDGIVPAMVRQVVGPEIADALQVPNPRFWTRFTTAGSRLMRRLERVEDDNRAARAVLDKAAHLLLTGSVRTLADGQRVTLDIPERLWQGWDATGAPLPRPGCPAAEPPGGTPPSP
ncbi:oxygenase MpaB family protein [Streptosporangium sp. CA-135522]|uniref:oxygenase MpaB family protein n=1 Tax=Streptosporangium sp. CA-135522 TaxID=3240072 RepID=UPI003D9149A3